MALGDGAVLAVTFGAGLLGLVYFDQTASRRTPTDARARAHGPGTAASELRPATIGSAAGRLALMIAIGIGLHNFAEGLAIGNSAARGEFSLAVLLVIGFGLHNATEGFGIVAPFTGQRPSWAISPCSASSAAAPPSFLGTIIGQTFVNGTLSSAFLGLAAGSILYVVIELLAAARKTNLKTITTWGLFLVLGFATGVIVAAAGA